MEKLLKLLKNNARLSLKDLSILLNQSEDVIQKAIEAYEAQGILKGYKALINDQKLDEPIVHAIIELKVTPKKELGFQDIIDRVVAFEEVDGVYLMAGDYDLAVFMSGKNIQEVAAFVSKRLSTLESVISSSTHFVLTKYKQDGIVLNDEPTQDPRIVLKQV
jgi:DNA-binding Lrp family transcriptional regulator